jgi:hypothetical protein
VVLITPGIQLFYPYLLFQVVLLYDVSHYVSIYYIAPVLVLCHESLIKAALLISMWSTVILRVFHRAESFNHDEVGTRPARHVSAEPMVILYVAASARILH